MANCLSLILLVCIKPGEQHNTSMFTGSEHSKDTKGHSKARMDETKQINISLNALKECIQARTLASTPGAGTVHVPYRRSKLTHLLKDVFDVSTTRLCATCMLATVHPTAKDVSQSCTTIKYSSC